MPSLSFPQKLLNNKTTRAALDTLRIAHLFLYMYSRMITRSSSLVGQKLTKIKFPLVNFFEICTVQGEVYTFSILFQKYLSDKIC